MADPLVDLEAARSAVYAHLAPTPLVRARGMDACLKLECVQKTGAYKVRGALAALSAQCARGDYRPVVAASAGNHAAGMAWAARALGLSATAVVPQDAPETKVAQTRSLGATVLRHGSSFEHARSYAQRLARQLHARLLAPFDDLDIIAGQATVGHELLAHAPDVVVVPVGGGGLASGICLAMAHTQTRVVGVRVRAAERMNSIADGTRVAALGEHTRSILHHYLHDLIEVSEQQVREAMARLYIQHGLVTEGAGALSYAALDEVRGHRRVAVVSGRNIDSGRFADVMESTPMAPRWPSNPRMEEHGATVQVEEWGGETGSRNGTGALPR